MLTRFEHSDHEPDELRFTDPEKLDLELRESNRGATDWKRHVENGQVWETRFPFFPADVRRESRSLKLLFYESLKLSELADTQKRSLDIAIPARDIQYAISLMLSNAVNVTQDAYTVVPLHAVVTEFVNDLPFPLRGVLKTKTPLSQSAAMRSEVEWSRGSCVASSVQGAHDRNVGFILPPGKDLSACVPVYRADSALINTPFFRRYAGIDLASEQKQFSEKMVGNLWYPVAMPPADKPCPGTVTQYLVMKNLQKFLNTAQADPTYRNNAPASVAGMRTAAMSQLEYDVPCKCLDEAYRDISDKLKHQTTFANLSQGITLSLVPETKDEWSQCAQRHEQNMAVTGVDEQVTILVQIELHFWPVVRSKHDDDAVPRTDY